MNAMSMINLAFNYRSPGKIIILSGLCDIKHYLLAAHLLCHTKNNINPTMDKMAPNKKA